MPPAGNDQYGPSVPSGVDGRLFFRGFFALVFFLIVFLPISPQVFGQFGARFSRNALMPSWASGPAAFCDITSLVYS